MDNEQQMIFHIMRTEGWDKYTDNPDDSGKGTKWGVTQATAEGHGFIGSVKNMTQEEAYTIYKVSYYDKMRVDDVNYAALAFQLLDFSVTSGVKKSSLHLQRILNVLNAREKFYSDVKPDGAIGSKTINALSAYEGKRGHEGMVLLNNKFYALRDAFYTRLAESRVKDETFEYGWSKRALESRDFTCELLEDEK